MERLQLVFCACCAFLVVSCARGEEECTEIRFTPGKTSAEIQGEAPAKDVICYSMRTGAGQQARIQLLEGANTIATVPGVPEAEARQDIAFTTQARQYEIRVGQLMRALEPEPFRMLVSVE